MADAAARPAYTDTTTLEVERGGVRIRIEGVPCRTSPVGGDAMLPGQLAEEIDDALEPILSAIERYNAQEATTEVSAG